jgi:hypothetical protein
MRNGQRAHAPAPTVYVLPEQAHLALVQMRDHLRLLARLTETGTEASCHDNILRPDAMAWCFSRLARDLDDIVGVAYWSEAAAAEDAARKPRRVSAN